MRPVAFVVALLLTLWLPEQSWSQAPTPSAPAPAGAQRPGAGPARDNAAPASGTAKIRGRVLSVETNAPLRRAQINLVAGQLNLRRFATTDADGRYEFTGLPAGRYNVTASKGGYVALQYGQRRAFEPGLPVALADGQDLSQIDIPLPRGSVIAGRVTDEFGEPVAAVSIQVQRYQFGPGGRRLGYAGGIGGFAQTNDLGEFRAYGLMPGEYVVSATVRGPMFQQGPNQTSSNEGYAPTFYPGTTNPAEAESVGVGLAQEVAIHLTLQVARMGRISGTVVDSEGKPAADVRLAVRSISGEGAFFSSGGAAAADGSFSLANIPPGEHVIEAMARSRTLDTPGEVGSVRVTLAGEEISNVRITTGRGATVSGVLVFNGTSPRTGTPGSLIRVTAEPAEPQDRASMSFFMEDRGVVADDGSFQLRGTGKVFFRPINLGQWTLTSVLLEGEDITDTPYDLQGAEKVEGLRIVLTDQATEVSGGVTNARDERLKDYVVVVQPTREMTAASLQRFLRTARPDQQGRYSFRRLPPGDYVVTAIESLEQGREWDPEYQPKLREAGRRFSVKEGESLALDLKLADGL